MIDAYAAWLSIVLKYHKSAEEIALFRESYKNVVREEASQKGFDIKKLRLEKGKIIPASQPIW